MGTLMITGALSVEMQFDRNVKMPIWACESLTAIYFRAVVNHDWKFGVATKFLPENRIHKPTVMLQLNTVQSRIIAYIRTANWQIRISLNVFGAVGLYDLVMVAVCTMYCTYVSCNFLLNIYRNRCRHATQQMHNVKYTSQYIVYPPSSPLLEHLYSGTRYGRMSIPLSEACHTVIL